MSDSVCKYKMTLHDQRESAYLGALFDQLPERICAWILSVWMDMIVQVVHYSLICVDDLVHILGAHFVLHPGTRARD